MATKKTPPRGKKRVLKAARLRLIPLTLAMLSLLLVVKVNDLYLNSRQLTELLDVRDARAADEKTPDAADPAVDAAATDAAAPPTDAAAAAPADALAVDNNAAAGDNPAEGEHAPAKPEKEPTTFGEGKLTLKEVEALKAKENQAPYTQNELDLLQNLTKRREELDKRSADLDVRATVLEATEKRITDKIGEMKTLQAELSQTVALYNKQQDAEIMSLVKIYENMKPGDAAAIFNEMDMPIMLEVIDKMSVRKVAPVLAGMDPKRARDVTQELAEMRKGRSSISDAAAQAAKP